MKSNERSQKLSLATSLRRFLNSLSIRSRIFSYFLIFTVLLLILLWVFQTVLLDDFYKYQKTSMLASSADTIAKNIGNEDLKTLVGRISEQNDVCVLVLTDNLKVVVSSDVSSGCLIHHINYKNLARFMTGLSAEDQMVFQEFPMIAFRNNQYDAKRFAGRVPPADEGKTKSMIAAKKVTMEDGQAAYIFLNAIITPVTATVDTLRHQLIYITCILILLSFLISLILTRRITQPIVATTQAARELTVGEFAPAETPISYREVAQLNQQLTQTARDLRKVEALQRELIANISHDLRTPLTLIEGYAEVMRDLPGENTPENMQVIIDETKRLTTLVNAVLDYSVSRGGENGLNPKVFDLTESILTILNRYQKLTEQDGYQVKFDFDRHVKVCADEIKVSQVVYNLINNALTYTGDDKTVTVVQTVLDNRVKIEIKDSGEGIDPEELPMIWSRYYRGNKSHKRAAIGTGLGLSIVQGILNSHHLEYGVSSEKDIGTSFWFWLSIEG